MIQETQHQEPTFQCPKGCGAPPWRIWLSGRSISSSLYPWKFDEWIPTIFFLPDFKGIFSKPPFWVCEISGREKTCEASHGTSKYALPWNYQSWMFLTLRFNQHHMGTQRGGDLGDPQLLLRFFDVFLRYLLLTSTNHSWLGKRSSLFFTKKLARLGFENPLRSDMTWQIIKWYAQTYVERKKCTPKEQQTTEKSKACKWIFFHFPSQKRCKSSWLMDSFIFG